eukprot:CAMPEP_0184648836 /NCGR_PEP_ID=MMETSP0308-20130426/6080_1 /TAXON_ID=38269 /ORGANISM="Gloeochaete witrockiana, Strain SAG 46.84" /LENGTH=47 /DNA_ID= /DNA_START= /DNA_END= /DNA_ORIENTATION=
MTKSFRNRPPNDVTEDKTAQISLVSVRWIGPLRNQVQRLVSKARLRM